jgi:hypothetical protein
MKPSSLIKVFIIANHSISDVAMKLNTYELKKLRLNCKSVRDGTKSSIKVQYGEIFWPRFFSWIYSIWAPDFGAIRILFSFSFSRSYSNISMNPRCRLLRGFKIFLFRIQN